MRWLLLPVAVPVRAKEPRRRSRFWPFAFGFLLGVFALFGVALYASLSSSSITSRPISIEISWSFGFADATVSRTRLISRT